jgi:hypothetical protein
MRYPAIIFSLIAIWVTGCDRSPVVQSEPPKKVTNIPSKILKVAVYRDGKVEIDGAAMSIGDATQRIGAAADSDTSVYYYREAGEEEPHPNACPSAFRPSQISRPMLMRMGRSSNARNRTAGRIRRGWQRRISSLVRFAL